MAFVYLTISLFETFMKELEFHYCQNLHIHINYMTHNLIILARQIIMNLCQTYALNLDTRIRLSMNFERTQNDDVNSFLQTLPKSLNCLAK